MGIVYLLLAACFWGMIGPISKVIFGSGLHPLETAFWRGLIAGIAFIIHWLVTRYRLPSDGKQILGIVMFGIFGVALLEGSYVYAIHHGGAALASVLLYSAPIWVNVASAFLFHEKVPRGRWAALGVSTIGVVGICLWGATTNFTAEALAWGLLSGLSYAGFYLAGKVYFHRTNPVVVYMIAFPVGSLIIWPFMSKATGLSWLDALTNIKHASMSTLTSLTIIGILCTYVAYWLYSKGLNLLPAGRAAIITMVEPIISMLLAAIIFGERFSVAGYFFAALVILGVVAS
jgi:DME family drug/metabolite transporter